MVLPSSLSIKVLPVSLSSCCLLLEMVSLCAVLDRYLCLPTTITEPKRKNKMLLLSEWKSVWHSEIECYYTNKRYM